MEFALTCEIIVTNCKGDQIINHVDTPNMFITAEEYNNLINTAHQLYAMERFRKVEVMINGKSVYLLKKRL